MSEAYWQEAFEIALDEMGLFSLVEKMTAEQRAGIGEALQVSHENYELAHYSPPASDRIAVVELEWRQRLEDERDRTEAARKGAEIAMRKVLRVHRDVPITVTDAGEVYRHDGRTERLA